MHFSRMVYLCWFCNAKAATKIPTTSPSRLLRGHSSRHNGYILKTLGDVPLQRVAHETSVGGDPEPFHHPVFVERHGPVRDAEPVGKARAEALRVPGVPWPPGFRAT